MSGPYASSEETIVDRAKAAADEAARRAEVAPPAPRHPGDSAITLTQMMDLTSANLLGNVHGGDIMKLIDTAAGLAAGRHAGGPVVTVALDEMTFLQPVRVGNLVVVKAAVNDVGRTSMEVGVRVEAEDLSTGERTHTSSAYLVFVALDGHGRPRPVPPLVPETDAERQRQAEAKIRRRSRLARAEAIGQQRGEPRPTGE